MIVVVAAVVIVAVVVVVLEVAVVALCGHGAGRLTQRRSAASLRSPSVGSR